MIKNIVFDFNGTLLSDTNLCFEILKELMTSHDLKSLTYEEFRDKFYFPASKFYHDVGFSNEEYVSLADYFNMQYNLRWRKETKLFNGVKESLESLRSANYRLFCLSASEEKFLIEQMKFLGIYDYFIKVCGGSNSYAHGKIEYGKIFAKENDIKPSETIMIGDTEHDYEVATALGFKCILFDQGQCSRKKLLQLNIPLAGNYDEIVHLIKHTI